MSNANELARDTITMMLFKKACFDRMCEKRSKYGFDWQTVPIEGLELGLRYSLEKRNMVDVANYAMMIDYRRKHDGNHTP